MLCDIPGFIRYLYPKVEIIQIFEKVGFKIQKTKHYYEKHYFGLLGIKNSWSSSLLLSHLMTPELKMDFCSVRMGDSFS
jgi:hypothetical protein